MARKRKVCPAITPLERMRQALIEARGNQLGAATLLGLTRQAVNNRVKKHATLQETLRMIEEEEKDKFEALVKDMAFEDKHPTMVLAWLNAKGRDRGWGRYGMEIRGQIDHDHFHDHRVVIEDMREEMLREIEGHVIIEGHAVTLPDHTQQPGSANGSSGNGRSNGSSD
jgi:predicted transcriptional regulator